ncbi:hypothetical protein SDRG_08584 [Saprolegnia diclina VS20]|uniref:TROVE domain-containing protein n=1 Tax=Saprolegnia diclina (strain VS20) TaxID=1156394 RepID=T0Q7Q4_SAPDV|nr:hypothetical protein SDRG_08584 [Saprolegnia diclina VS20]EQC33904.1 hypothetical protein SDRG_08584 [Saprolegnia diclina VS20]|eukprot:XP_008612699.1 hypothetical protein SDRG_08584 [Saprolegnia diclina VS20]
MASFAEAAKALAAQKMTTTDNGALTHATTTSARVDLFAGVLRGTSLNDLEAKLVASYAEDPLHTLKIIAYIRDIRGGKGERLLGRQALAWLATHDTRALLHNLEHYVSVYGRYDDLLALVGTPAETFALSIFAQQLKKDLAALHDGKPISLCAKWVPSENKKADKKDHVNGKLAKLLNVRSAELRKTYLSPLRKSLTLLESLMCAKEWEKINLNKVPSVAMKNHGKPKHAFERHLPDAFATWKAGLKTGETKVNAAVLYPHQIVDAYYNGQPKDELLEAQWAVLETATRALGTLTQTLVMSDVSGSMSGTPMQVSIALGIMVSSIVSDEFHNLVLTFESSPRFHHIDGDSLHAKVKSLRGAPWGGSTDFAAAFRAVIHLGVSKQIPRERMPKKLIVVSDMQFDRADRNFETNYAVLAKEFAAANYDVPHLVFWNVNGNAMDFAALATQASVSLISGFSPNVLKAVLAGEDAPTPFQTMLTALLDVRYDLITLPPEAADADLGFELV